ncbi:MAG: hypothetical protein WCF85_02060 [Rhodospirillaceae bacterium]
MRILLIVLVMALSGIITPVPANAQDLGGILRLFLGECEHGDRESCRIHRMYADCDRGDHRACEEIRRERYHERKHEFEHARGRDEFMRESRERCERGDREACRLHHLYRECERGDRRACEEANRERNYERR